MSLAVGVVMNVDLDVDSVIDIVFFFDFVFLVCTKKNILAAKVEIDTTYPLVLYVFFLFIFMFWGKNM